MAMAFTVINLFLPTVSLASEASICLGLFSADKPFLHDVQIPTESPNKVFTFFTKYSLPIIGTGFFESPAAEPNVIGLINGFPAKLLYRAGLGNRGVYFYTDQQGQKHAVKTLKEPKAFLVINKISAADMTEFLEQLEIAKIAESLGGPTVYGFGIAQIDKNRVHFYLDLEHLFPRQKTKSVGDLVHLAQDYDPQIQLKKIFEFFHKHADLILKQLGNLYYKPFAKQIITQDPDFIFNKNGARWIDTGNWFRVRSHEEFLGDFEINSYKFFPLKKNSSAVPFQNPETIKAFKLFWGGFISELKKDQQFSESYKHYLIQRILGENSRIAGTSTDNSPQRLDAQRIGVSCPDCPDVIHE